MKLKDKKIELLQPTNVKDAEGFSTEALIPIAPPLWAYFRQLSGKEIYANAATVITEQVMFVINYRSDLSTALLVRFNGVLYDIVRVDVFEGYRGDITLYCRQQG
jgi:SPP1 family predicted phage head-tail adaptor